MNTIIKKQYLIAAIVVLIIGIYMVTGPTYSYKKDIIDCTTDYLTALCTNNLDQAKTRATGQALGMLNNTPELPNATIEKTTIKVISSNKSWGKAKAVTEIRLNDNSIDVSWNDVDLINTSQGWKIYAIKPCVPEVKTGIIMNIETEELKSVFEQYLESTSIKYLVGPARVAQEQSPVKLNPIEYKNLEVSRLAGNNAYVLIKATYQTERDVDLCVTFYKSNDGWKIVNVQQI